ncbi:MAG: ATP-dependent DNA helicase [Candidatus Roizmanbacteria bacterium]
MDIKKVSTNKEQELAIMHNTDPLLIVAGAGTGKTSVIIEKIKFILDNGLAKPDEILALTFTEKASLEMEERIDLALPYGLSPNWILTFHSFADRILKEYGIHIGISPDYTLLSKTESIFYFKSKLYQFDLKYFRPLGNPQKFISILLNYFSKLQDEDISSTEYEEWLEKFVKLEHDTDIIEQSRELVSSYKLYKNIKAQDGYMDFSDLISYAIELLRKRPNIAQIYQKQFKYVLIDEFQDTNIAQYELVKLLCPPNTNPKLTVVGDDSQAIYKFRGASVSNILSFTSDYPTAKQITLVKNYRSTQTILDTSYKAIKYNDPDTLECKLGISKQLIGQQSGSPDDVQFQLFRRSNDEASYIANEILKEMSNSDRSYRDFALLVRANSHADTLISELERYNIPYQFLGPESLFRRPEIKDLIAYLKVLVNIDDTVSLYRVLHMGIFHIDGTDMNALLLFSKKSALPLFRSITIYLSLLNDNTDTKLETYKPYLPSLSEETQKILITIVGIINKHIQTLKFKSAGELLFEFLSLSGELERMTNAESPEDENRIQTISHFFTKLKDREHRESDNSVFSVVEYLDMVLDLGDSSSNSDSDTTIDAVQIMTIHGSKGLEFPVVFISSLIQGRFPTYEKKDPIAIPSELIKETLPEGDYHLQEERRLFYVAMTRAKEKLYLTTSKLYGEGKRERKVSQFVAEALGKEIITQANEIQHDEQEQLSIFEFKKPNNPPIKDPVILNQFSYSQLENFNTCPLQYKYQHILKLPTISGHSASLGDSIHRSLQRFYIEYKHNPQVSVEELVHFFHKSWIPIGFDSETQQEHIKIEGEKMLRTYFKTFHTEYISIISLETVFKIKLSNDITINGKIDRIDQGSEGEIEIIDYKTGKMPEDKKLKNNLQLSIYALASIDKSLLNIPLEKVKMSFIYLSTNEKKSFTRTSEELLKVKEDIFTSVDIIRSSHFEPKVGPWCNFCPFKMICEEWK